MGVSSLQAELDFRGQYYFKGFGSVLQALYGNIEIFNDTKAQLPTALIRVLNEGASPDEASNLIDIIHENGQSYRIRLTAILNELRELPGQENANLRSTCLITGEVLTNAL